MKSLKTSGESADCPEYQDWVDSTLAPILNQYTTDCIYNCDESALFWRVLPDRTIAFKNEKVHGRKVSKARLTMHLTCNMDGSDKYKVMIVNKFKMPLCFRRANITPADLPVLYSSSSKGWMTRELFRGYLTKLNNRMRSKRKKILLVMDNHSSHIQEEQHFTHIKLLYLPPNTTSKLQPLDQGIIRSLKSRYRRKLAYMYLAAIESKQDAVDCLKKMNVKQACDLVATSWKAVTEECIQKCFKAAGWYKCMKKKTDGEQEEGDAQPARDETEEGDAQPARDETPEGDARDEERVDDVLWKKVQQHLEIDSTFDDWARIDEELSQRPQRTDDEILEDVKVLLARGADKVMEDESAMREKDAKNLDEDDLAELEDLDNTTSASSCLPPITSSALAFEYCSVFRTYLQKIQASVAPVDALEKTIVELNLQLVKKQVPISDFMQRSNVRPFLADSLSTPRSVKVNKELGSARLISGDGGTSFEDDDTAETLSEPGEAPTSPYSDGKSVNRTDPKDKDSTTDSDVTDGGSVTDMETDSGKFSQTCLHTCKHVLKYLHVKYLYLYIF